MKDALSRRERQIMDIVYRFGRASVSEVHAELPDAPSYSAVRALMGTLLDKGHLTHHQAGKRYVYEPTVSSDAASVSALRRVVTTFFDGSPARAALALVADGELDEAELEALRVAIASARAEGR
jgi:BlaI family penicillinase repressor